MHEIWKAIPGYEDLYEVSNLGNVRRISPHPNVKLFSADIEDIRAEFQRGVSQYVLAKRYGVARQTIESLLKTYSDKQRCPHLLKPKLGNKGYYYVCLSHQKKLTNYYIHTLVAAAFLGPRPSSMQIDHINMTRTDNRSVNLEYVTASINMLRALKGKSHTQGKLQRTDIPIIRAMLAQGIKQKVIAEKFNVVASVISRIKLGHRWGTIA